MKYKIPKILLYSRLAFSFIIFYLAYLQGMSAKYIVIVLMYLGIFADIFDGIIARKLNISTENFRLLDTVFDLIFYFSIVYFIYKTNNLVIFENASFIISILILEFLMYFTNVVRFGNLPSPHAILSKFWGLLLIIEFTLLIFNVEGNHFTIALIIGIFVHIDRLLIYLLLKKWDHDIPSSYHAYLIRNGKEIKRNDLFNG